MYKVNIIIGAAYKINKKHIFSFMLQSDPQKLHSIGRAVLKVRSYGANIPFTYPQTQQLYSLYRLLSH